MQHASSTNTKTTTLHCKTLHYTSLITDGVTFHYSYNGNFHCIALHYTKLQLQLQVLQYTTLYTTLQYTTQHTRLHYTNYTTPQLQLKLQYTNYTTVQLQLHHTTLQLQLHYHRAAVVLQPLQPLQKHKHTSSHPSIHQWIRSAIRESQEPTSSIRFIFETSATALCSTTGI